MDDEKGMFGEYEDIKKQYKTCSWFLTICNYTELLYNAICNSEKIRYLVIGREICPTTGTPHIHFFIYYKNDVSFTQMKKRFPTAHIEVCRKFKACSDYCKKDGDFLELGEIPSQGARKDLELVKDQILNGRKVDDIVIQEPILYHQYGRTLHKIEDIVNRKKIRDTPTAGVWYYGHTGSGKSKLAFNKFSDATHYVWNLKNNWNDGYNQQDIVILDDFRGQLTFSELLNMCDMNNTFFAERRGRERLTFISKQVIITSSLNPHSVYKNLDANDKWEQFYRRFRVYDIEIKKKFDKVLSQLKNL